MMKSFSHRNLFAVVLLSMASAAGAATITYELVLTPTNVTMEPIRGTVTYEAEDIAAKLRNPRLVGFDLTIDNNQLAGVRNPSFPSAPSGGALYNNDDSLRGDTFIGRASPYSFITSTGSPFGSSTTWSYGIPSSSSSPYVTIYSGAYALNLIPEPVAILSVVGLAAFGLLQRQRR